jgi:drug/metabolite transporter (DMT)-like permease
LTSSAKNNGGMLAAGALVFNAFVWGVSWWPFRELQNAGLHPLWATAAIYLLVCASLLVVYFSAARDFLANPRLWWLSLAAGVANVGFNWAVTVGDVVRVVLLFYLMPAWSVLVAWSLLGEKPTRASLARLALAMAGVLIVLKTPDSPWPIPQSAVDWLALMGGLSFAITNSLLKQQGRASGGGRMFAMFAGGALAATAVAVLGLSMGLLPLPVLAALPAASVPIFVGLCLAFFMGNAAMQFGAARLTVSTTSLVMLTEILFASVSAAVLGAAAFSPRVFWGGSLIVLAALLAALANNRNDR